jgi:hypothetical protein
LYDYTCCKKKTSKKYPGSISMSVLCHRLPSVIAVVLLFGLPQAAFSDPAPLLIAPHISGQEFCPLAAENPEIVTNEAAEEYCASHDQNSSAPLRALLDSVGPVTSPSGHFQLGYVLGFPLMRYFKESGGS